MKSLSTVTLRKVTRRLIPFLFLLYIVAWLDRVNVGFAALHMNSDLRFSSAAFGIGSGIFFLGYCQFEVPSNIILDRVGARLWIARIMVTWGVISGSMMFVRTPTGFYVLRFLLGVAEAGFFPGVIYYLSLWYPAAQRARAVAAFMAAIPVTALIGGPLSGGILGLDGAFGLAGWQWLFLLEGLPSILLGVIVLLYLTDRPEKAGWLAPAERDWLAARLARERNARQAAHPIGTLAALTHGTVWQLGIIFFFAPIVCESTPFTWLCRSLSWGPGVLAVPCSRLRDGQFCRWRSCRSGTVLRMDRSGRCRRAFLRDRRRPVGSPLSTRSSMWADSLDPRSSAC